MATNAFRDSALALRAQGAFVSDEEINDKTVLSAIEDSQLGDFVGKCSNGINHDIHEKAINISEGEKQRLGICFRYSDSCSLNNWFHICCR